MLNIKNLSLEQLKSYFVENGMVGYRASQVKKWLYAHDVDSFLAMTNIAKEAQKTLTASFTIDRLSVEDTQISVDGTRKYLLKLADGKKIESVWIPSKDRRTLCVSTQVGCGMGCDFCLTATMGFVRNLSVYEIIEQVACVKRNLPQGEKISNLVFMGMGEPLANTKNLYAALEILLDPDCFNFSRHHITVSTSGLAREIEVFGDKTPVKLAISLNATTDAVRNQLMPINKKYNLQTLLASCQKMKLHKRNSITFEYVMLHGINDTMDDAKRLVKLLSNIKAKINLLPFNEYPLSPYKRPDEDWVRAFQKYLLDRNFIAVVRQSRGRDILGACGQLATKKTKDLQAPSYAV